MKALVLTEYNKFEYLDVPDPVPADGEVLIEVRACGICGSDVHGMDGATGRRRPPIVMGHEAAGVIARLGRGVEGWKTGERVTFDSTIYCGRCWFCRRGRINLCDNRRVLGVSCEQYRQNGAFAQFVAVPQHILYRLPEGLSFERAAMVEALSIAVHAVERTAIGLNDTAVVVGAGMIGLLVVQVLRSRGCGASSRSTSNRPNSSLPPNSARTLRSSPTTAPPPRSSASRPGAGRMWPSRSSARRPRSRPPWPRCERAASSRWWATSRRRSSCPCNPSSHARSP